MREKMAKLSKLKSEKNTVVALPYYTPQNIVRIFCLYLKPNFNFLTNVSKLCSKCIYIELKKNNLVIHIHSMSNTNYCNI